MTWWTPGTPDLTRCVKCGSPAARTGIQARYDSRGCLEMVDIKVADHTSLRCRACGIVARKEDLMKSRTLTGMVLRGLVANMRVRLTEEYIRIWGSA